MGGGPKGLNDYHTDINDLLSQDRANGLGTDMYETVQDRNELPQIEQPEFNEQINTQPLQQMPNLPSSNVQNQRKELRQMTLFEHLTRNGLNAVYFVLLVLLAEPAFAANEPCIATGLSQEQQQQLDKYLIIKGRTGLLLSPKLIPACDTRQIISQWLTHHLGTPVKPTEEEFSEDHFAAQHRATLNKVVLRVWPSIAASPAVPEDGALSSEKWGILDDPLIYDSVVDALLSDDIKKEGLSRDGAFLLFSRPLPHAYQLLEPILTNPRALLDERLYAFALLIREEPKAQIPTIDSLVRGFALNDGQKQTVERLKSKISAGRTIEWADLDGLLGDDV